MAQFRSPPFGRPDRPASAEAPLPAGVLKARFTALLCDEVRPVLKSCGFAKSGPTFSRRRDRLYDVINFQGSSINGAGTVHRFYVNVAIGSLDVDDEADSAVRPRLESCLVHRRWEQFAAGAPARVEILPGSDLAELAADVCHWLVEVLTFLDTIDSTDALVDLAIAGNLLHQMTKTCAYLARVGDIERLRFYVASIRDRFGSDARWPLFAHQLSEAVGPRAGQLRNAGLLDGRPE